MRRARVWSDSVGKPSEWTLESTDSNVTGAGDFRLAYVKISSARWVYVDDIVLSAW